MNELNTTAWPTWQRILFRFAFLFFLLVVFLINNGAFILWYFVQSLYEPLLHQFIVWVGKAILHLPYPITVFTNGSGDTTYDWVLLFTITAVALIGTLVWSVAGRRQLAYPVLYYWLMVLLRYYVGLMLISYGLVKVVQLQFPAPGLYRLLQPYGNSSPMGLAWTFLGFSQGYNIFMGIAELAAGLLLFRRTTTAGAVITLMTTANVMAVNYFYDVPVKMVSTLLVLMTLVILSRDIKRLFRFFFSSQKVDLPPIKAPSFAKPWKRKGIFIAKLCMLITGPALGMYEIINHVVTTEDTPPPYYGLYQVETFVRNGDTLPPLRTDSTRWYRVAIENAYNLRVVMTNDSATRYAYTADTSLHQIVINPIGDSTTKYTMQYAVPAPGTFALTLHQAGDTIHMEGKLQKEISAAFLLTSRGFRWINETPFNR